MLNQNLVVTYLIQRTFLTFNLVIDKNCLLSKHNAQCVFLFPLVKDVDGGVDQDIFDINEGL